jgi:diphosphomevalonate decarboxylase
LNRSPLSVFKSGANSHTNESSSFFAEWESPSNIAIVKYWGKTNGQLAANPSLSMTLSKAVTRTSVMALLVEKGNSRLTVNGDPNHLFTSKLKKLVKWLTPEIPVLEEFSLNVTTVNTFPHSAGIASSASGISAFTLCLLTVISKITGKKLSRKKFLQIASYVSRMGSGSACRSVYGGFSLWGKTMGVHDSSDFYAVSLKEIVHADFMNLHDAIMVVSSSPKSLSSTAGHELMRIHPFARDRFNQARLNIQETLTALKTGDIDKLAAISENEALTLHSLIMSSKGGTILMEPNSVMIIKRVQQARRNGLPVFFTLDAGPNVHLLYPDNSTEKVENFIRSDLAQFCENGLVIFDRCGDGPIPCKI